VLFIKKQENSQKLVKVDKNTKITLILNLRPKNSKKHQKVYKH